MGDLQEPRHVLADDETSFAPWTMSAKLLLAGVEVPSLVRLARHLVAVVEAHLRLRPTKHQPRVTLLVTVASVPDRHPRLEAATAIH